MDLLMRLLTGRMVSPLPESADFQNVKEGQMELYKTHPNFFLGDSKGPTKPQVLAAHTTPTQAPVQAHTQTPPHPTPTLIPGAPENPYMGLLKQYFPPDQVNNASNVMFKESGFRPDASHLNNDGTTDYGLFQLNSIHQKDFERKGLTLRDLLDAAKNIQYAAQMQQRQGWEPWYGADSLGLTSRSQK